MRMIFGTGIIVRNFRKVLHKRWFYPVILYIAVLCVSELLNYGKYVDALDCLYTLEHIIFVISVFVYLSTFSDKDWRYFFSDIRIIGTIYIIGTMLFTFPYVGHNIEDLGIVFFIGSRAESVQCMTLIVTLLMIGDFFYGNKISLSTWFVLALSLIMTVIYHSGQGIMIWLVMGGMLVVLVKKKSIIGKLFSPFKILVVTIAMNIVMVSQVYKNVPVIAWFITDILKKDLSMTGRSFLYSYLPSLYIKSPIWGFGYNNSVIKDELSVISAGWNSAHNSFGIIMFESGYAGLIAFLFILYLVLSQLFKNYSKESILLYSLLIGYMISGIVSGVLGSGYYWMLCAVSVNCFLKQNVYAHNSKRQIITNGSNIG